MRRVVILLLTLALPLAACGGGSSSSTSSSQSGTKLTTVPTYVAQCPQASSGHGAPGICGPRKKLQLLPTLPPANPPYPIYPDLSNNDPCYCGASLKAQGYKGLIVKALQGTGFVDWTAAPMVNSARAAGLAVGAYDFDQDYTVAEAQLFVARLRVMGIGPHSTNTFPAYFDVEYGRFSYSGLLAQISYVRSQGYRVGIYTGTWYWTPHAGCRWPAGLVSAWISGYPNASAPCGSSNFNAHQYTSTPIDKTAYIGSSFQSFVSGGSAPAPKPRPVSPYANLTRSEAKLAQQYDGARQQPGKYHVYLTKTLQPELQHAAGVIWVVANRHKPPRFTPNHRGDRFRKLHARAEGRKVS